MNIAQALKEKNRLIGELNRAKEILRRENPRRNDSQSKVDREAVWNKIKSLTNAVVEIKTKISVANTGIYDKIALLAEMKSRISDLESMPKREGDEILFIGRDQEKMTYQWESYLNTQRIDEEIEATQKLCDRLQDDIDAYNATKQI